MAFLIFVATWALGSQASPPIASLNGQEITEAEARALFPEEDLQSAAAIERVILFKLAVEAAKKEKLENDPEVRLDIERALYRGFLEKKARENAASVEVSEAELKVLYAKEPLVRLRHLYLPAANPAQRVRAKKLLKRVKREAEQGKSFEKLVLKHSKDASRSWGGDTDFKGVNSLPPLFYQEALRIPEGKISDPLETSEGLHLFQLVRRQAYADASAVYLGFLKNKERARKEAALLSAALSDLKQDARIEIRPSRSQSE